MAKQLKQKKKKVNVTALKKRAQGIFNKWVRERDKDLPCISCGEFKVLQAGHFFSVRKYECLRFNEDNVNGECAACNRFNDSHLIFYNDNLIKRIGKERVDALKEQSKTVKRYSIEELRAIIEKYKNGKKLM